VTEVEALGTGGGIRNVADRLESAAAEPVFVLNGDVLSGHDMAAQLHRHHDAGAAATLHLVRVPDPRAFGSVPTDGDGRVRAFVEKSPQPVTDQVNAGCYVLTRAVIDAIPAGQVVSVERDVFPQLLADGAVLSGYLDDAYWIDVGTPASYVRASADLVRGLVTSPLVATAGESSTAPDAQVAGDAHLLGGSAVGPGALIEDGAVVDGSVVLAGARVGAGAKVLRSVVGAAASVGAGAVLEDAVIGDAAYVGARNRLLVGARLWPRVTLPDA
jgi:mannose-1-phosphate guanylyltransferase